MEILIAAAFVLLGGFFSGSETAFISINRFKLHANLESKDRRYRALNILTDHPEDMMGMFLIGTNICVIAATLIITRYLSNALNGNPLAPLYVTLIMTPVVMIFTDVLPKIIYRKFSDKIMLSLSYIYFALYIIFYPVQFIFVKSIKLILTLLGVRKKRKGTVTREEFKLLLDTTAVSGSIQQKEKEFIESIMNFKDITAKEIMVPLIRMVCVEELDNIAKAADMMTASSHSRLPVYKSRVDNIIGFIENKDIIMAEKNEPVNEYLKKTLYVPEFVRIDDLLVDMQQNASQMAFTVDEYGGVSGVVTTQDLVTEIVGEFVDIGEGPIKKDGDIWIVDGLLDIDELEDELGIYIDKEGFETVAGFVMSQLGKIPTIGEWFNFKKYTFEVIQLNNLRIEKVKIYHKKRRKQKGLPKENKME